MSLNVDWMAALGGAAVGYIAKAKVEDTKAAAKKAVSETASAAAVAAAQAIAAGQPAPQGQGQKTN